MFGSAYVTITEFTDAAFGFDVSDLPEAQLNSILANASRLAEQYAGTVWAQDTYSERHEWRSWSRRVYLRHWPVLGLILARLWIGANLYSTLTVTDFVLSNDQHYIELASLASATTLTPELLTLGLQEPLIEVSYRAGYGSWVDSTATLAEALDASETEWTVSDGTKFAQYDKIRVGDETAFITSISANTLTVARDAPASTHATGLAVYKLQSAAPNEVKVAVCLIAAAAIAQRRLVEEGIAGVRSFVIGTYSLTVGRGDGEASGFAGLIPEAAASILRGYRFATAR